MVTDIIYLFFAAAAIVWSNIITYNIPAMDNKAAERVARVLSLVLVFLALGLVAQVG